MAVSTKHTKDILMGDGVNTKFPFTFQIIEPEQVKCLKVLASGEEIDLLPAEYEVQLINNGAGGGGVTYPLVGDPLSVGDKLVVYRSTEIKQDYTPPNSQSFDAVAIRTEIDRLTMQNQEQEESLSRSVQTSMGSDAKPEEYMENVNNMLANARKLQEETVSIGQQNLTDVKKQVNIATEKAEAAALSEQNAAEAAKFAEDTVEGFDGHCDEKQTNFDNNAVSKTDEFNNNAALKQKSVDDSAELARKYAQGTLEELASGSAKHWRDEAEKIYNRTDIHSQSIYQDRVIMDTPVIVLSERKCRYVRSVVSGDVFTIDVSNVKQTDKDITIDLILIISEAVPFDLSAIIANESQWLNEEAPDLSEIGEHWIALLSVDGGNSWRASYEGKFAI